MDAATTPRAWRVAVAVGLCGSLVGIGLARFAYSPLIPALVAAGWFNPSQAAYLGAANLTGYFVGALAARRLGRWLSVRTALQAAMALAALSFFACASPVAFGWFFFWRFAAGVAGAVVMVLAAPAVLAVVPPRRRGAAGGVIFTGVGIGIAASGMLVPPLLRLGLTATWLGLGLFAALLTGLSWTGWPPSARTGTGARLRIDRAVAIIIAVYGLNAVGVVPHMIFLVDFVARGLGRGMIAGAACWVAFGMGAIIGPTLAGVAADRFGFQTAMRLALLLEAAAVAAPLIATAPPALLTSAAVIGAFTPGVAPLTLGRIHTRLAAGTETARAAWSGATIAWAVGQAAGAQTLSYIFGRTGGYEPLFAAGVVALIAAFILDCTALGRDPTGVP